MLRQCFSSGTAADGHTPYKARPSQNWQKITTYDHVHQIFITSCTWFRRGVLCDRGFTLLFQVRSGSFLISYHELTHWPLGDLDAIIKLQFSVLFYWFFFFRSSNDNAPRWMPWNLTDDKSTLVQVMAWCHQATSHCLSQGWPCSMSPYGITRPQWVKQQEGFHVQPFLASHCCS